LLLVALSFLAATPGNGRAEMIQWSYFASGGSNYPLFGNPGVIAPVNQIYPLDGIWIAGGGKGQEVGPQTVPVVEMTSVAGHYLFHNAPLTILMNIKDQASQASGNLTFQVLFDGTLDGPSRTSTVYPVFLSPTKQLLTLGGNRYTVTIGPFHPFTWVHLDPPGIDPTNGQFEGSIDAQVNVSPVQGASTPEPSCIVLAGMGALTFAGTGWRWRRR
jgi:hypothetical protein